MQIKVTYRAEVTADPFGSFIAHFEDVPGAVALGENAQAALDGAADALKTVLEARLAEGGTLPSPKSSSGTEVTATIHSVPKRKRRLKSASDPDAVTLSPESP